MITKEALTVDHEEDAIALASAPWLHRCRSLGYECKRFFIRAFGLLARAKQIREQRSR